MKKIYYILSVALATGFFASCSNDPNGTDELIPGNMSELPDFNNTRAFPEDDGSQKLEGSAASKLNTLLNLADKEFSTTFLFSMPAAQYEEIKAFADKLIEDDGATTDARKYRLIYNWVRTNVQYNSEHNPNFSNEPYDVFINRKCICQGYTNLMNVMLYSQGIPAVNANGYMQGMGHAWNYVFFSGRWSLSDATNSIEHKAAELADYERMFVPISAAGNVRVTDEYAFNYFNQHLNLNEVKSAPDAFVVPFSVTFADGTKIQLSSFSPTVSLPENVKEIYIGSNITNLGQENLVGLAENAPSVEAAFVDEANPMFKSHAGIVYRKQVNVPMYIPAAMKSIALLPFETMGKEHIKGHQNVESLYVAEGTARIEDWAVEKCPNLKVAYVPLNTEISEKAFTEVHPDFKVIRQDMTGIKDIIAD